LQVNMYELQVFFYDFSLYLHHDYFMYKYNSLIYKND